MYMGGSLVKPISIHVPREGHDILCVSVLRRHYISIHVPREGHDSTATDYMRRCQLISIHVPREGHDHIILAKIINISQFQSTCPARGTT